jgi:hypothetical protein
MPNICFFVSPAESATLKRAAVAAGHQNISAWLRALTGLGPSNLGGARKNAGRKPKTKETNEKTSR